MRILPLFIFLLGALTLALLDLSLMPRRVISPENRLNRVDSLKSAMIIAGIDSPEINTLVAHLDPILYSSLADRKLDNWYVNKSVWGDQFLAAKNVHLCAQIIYEKCMEEGEISNASKVKHAISRMYTYDGDFSAAIKTSQEAYELANRVSDSLSLGWNLALLSSNLVRIGDYTAALDYGQRALEIGRKINNPGVQALSYTALGAIEAYQFRYDSSLALIERGLILARTNNLPELVKRGVLNVSYNYNNLGRYDEAISYLNDNIDFTDPSLSLPSVFLYFNLHGAYAGKKDFAKADNYLQLGCGMADELDFVYAQRLCAEYQTKLYEDQGLYEQALAAQQRKQTIQREMMGMEQSRAFQSLQARLSLVEKDLKIEKLNQARKASEQAYRTRIRGLVVATCFLVVFTLGIYLFMRNRNRVNSAVQQKQIAETKLHVLQSQMQPHFVFNALGGIQNYVLKSKKIEAYNYLGKFATLLRIITKSTTKVSIELDQELSLSSRIWKWKNSALTMLSTIHYG